MNKKALSHKSSFQKDNKKTILVLMHTPACDITTIDKWTASGDETYHQWNDHKHWHLT